MNERRPSMSNPSSPSTSLSFEQQEHHVKSPDIGSPQLYTKDELIIKIPSSVQSMSPTRLPPTPRSEASKAVDMSSTGAYGSESPMNLHFSTDAPPSFSSSSPLPATTNTTSEVTTWPSNDMPHDDDDDDIYFAAQGYEPWFDKTSSFNVSSVVGPPSPQHSTDRLAMRATTTSFTSSIDHQTPVRHDASRKVSNKMYSDHIDQVRPISPPANDYHHYHSTHSSQRRSTNNAWSSATLVDSWEGFQPFVQTVKPTPVMKHPRKYRQPDQEKDTLKVLDEEEPPMAIEQPVDDENQQQKDTIITQQPISSGSSDQYEDALSSPPKSDHETDQDYIQMTFDDVELEEPNRSKFDHYKVDEDDEDEEGEWVLSAVPTKEPVHHAKRYSRDELVDLQPLCTKDSVIGQEAKQRIDNFINARQV